MFDAGWTGKISCAITKIGKGKPPSLVESIANDHGRKLSVQEFSSMVTNWVSIKDDHVIWEMEVEEAVEIFENSSMDDVNNSE